MPRPLIGLNTSTMDMDDPLKAKAICHFKYIDAIAENGGVPVIIPPYRDRSMLDAVLKMFDGFLLVGGPDYDPAHYGGHAQPPDEVMHPRRHAFDLWLAGAILEKTRKPVLGICGGHQLINIALGGALVQDLKTEWSPDAKHASTLLHSDSQRTGTAEAGNVYRHEIRVNKGCLLAKIAGTEKILTNSYHHQAVQPDRVGRGLIPTAWSPDGVIEAIELATPDRFLLGVQWHPERQAGEAQHKAIFAALVKACG